MSPLHKKDIQQQILLNKYMKCDELNIQGRGWNLRVVKSQISQ